MCMRGFTLSLIKPTSKSDWGPRDWMNELVLGAKHHICFAYSRSAAALTCTPGPPDRNADWSWWGSAGEGQAPRSPTRTSERGGKTWGTRATWGRRRLRFWCSLHIYLQSGVGGGGGGGWVKNKLFKNRRTRKQHVHHNNTNGNLVQLSAKHKHTMRHTNTHNLLSKNVSKYPSVDSLCYSLLLLVYLKYICYIYFSFH